MDVKKNWVKVDEVRFRDAIGTRGGVDVMAENINVHPKTLIGYMRACEMPIKTLRFFAKVCGEEYEYFLKPQETAVEPPKVDTTGVEEQLVNIANLMEKQNELLTALLAVWQGKE